VPAWDEEHTALLWFRGTYFSAQRTDAAVVGIIQDATAKPAPRIFQDATAANTFLADGSGITPTGPSPVRGLADGRWHVRSGYGNGGSLLASAEISGEDAPLLKTELPDGLEIGIYDVWINFWGKPTADWRIRAGLSPDHLMIFRHMAAQTADAGAYSGELLTNQEDLHLYQAFVGRITKSVEGQVHYVYVDDHAVQTGTTSLIGDEARTWYDGVTYARSARDANGGAEDQSLPASVAMHQNYPNPFSSGTRILFEIPAPSTVRLEVFDSGGRLVRTLHRGALPAGTHARMFDAQGLSSGTYFYRMTVDGQSRVGSMTLIR
jgi:hypothetical protein